MGRRLPVVNTTRCESCGSSNLRGFSAEIAIHPPAEDIYKPAVFVFPQLVLCLECGVARFIVTEADMYQLRHAGGHTRS